MVSARNPLGLEEEVLRSSVFEAAITHRSAGSANYERLEFLGDAVLNMVIAEHVYIHSPESTEGDLSRLRAALVNESALAEVAQAADLGQLLRLGQGELKSGGFRRESILADALEAIVGAVFLLKGFERARAFILDLFAERLSRLPRAEELKDPKSRLQELLQARNLPLPTYELCEVTGQPHDQSFTALCTVDHLGVSASGQGSSRRRAEQAAALAVLERMMQTADTHAGS